MFKNYCSAYKGIFFSHTASHFFDVAAGYNSKMFLVQLKNLLFSFRKTKFKHTLSLYSIGYTFIINFNRNFNQAFSHGAIHYQY
jgi:hypothetical protein